MTRVSTFVFIDLETSGLPSEELNKTRITELSLVAVRRGHLLGAAGAPRVQQRLTLCLNPRRLVQPAATAATGLCNDLLEAEPPFNTNTFNVIDSFLKLLTKPVCLVAHNGLSFDYPILKKHLEDLHVSFADDLLCADSFHAFYHIMEKKETKVQETVALDAVDCSSMQRVNETTPKQKKLDIKPVTPTTPCKEEKHDVKVIRKARRRFPWSAGEKPKYSYKLEDLYQRLLNRTPVNAHRAEADCLLTIECVVCVAEEFTSWVDGNCIKFTEIKPMTIGVPLGD